GCLGAILDGLDGLDGSGAGAAHSAGALVRQDTGDGSGTRREAEPRRRATSWCSSARAASGGRLWCSLRASLLPRGSGVSGHGGYDRLPELLGEEETGSQQGLPPQTTEEEGHVARLPLGPIRENDGQGIVLVVEGHEGGSVDAHVDVWLEASVPGDVSGHGEAARPSLRGGVLPVELEALEQAARMQALRQVRQDGIPRAAPGAQGARHHRVVEVEVLTEGDLRAEGLQDERGGHRGDGRPVAEERRHALEDLADEPLARPARLVEVD